MFVSTPCILVFGLMAPVPSPVPSPSPTVEPPPVQSPTPVTDPPSSPSAPVTEPSNSPSPPVLEPPVTAPPVEAIEPSPAPDAIASPPVDPPTSAPEPPAPVVEPRPDPEVVPAADPTAAEPERTREAEPVERAPGLYAGSSEPPSLDEPSRRGVLLGASVGYVGCRTEICWGSIPEGAWRYRGGGLGQLELGFRAGRVAPSLSLGIGGGPVEYTGELSVIDSTMRFTDIGAGVLVFPVARSRFDPFFGLRFGYARTRDHIAVPEIDVEATSIYSRFGARISAGLYYYVLPALSIGPRFDITLPMGGGVCTELREATMTTTDCIDASSFSRADRLELPRWWSVSLGLQAVIPRIRL